MDRSGLGPGQSGGKRQKLETSMQGCTHIAPRSKPDATGEDKRRIASNSLEMKTMDADLFSASNPSEMDALQIETYRRLLMTFSGI
jgi:hypothetical protein